MDQRGPFFNLTEAARYCGYRVSYFGKTVLKEYDLPRSGPKGTRFAASILDAFMACPELFKKAPARSYRQKVAPLVLRRVERDHVSV